MTTSDSLSTSSRWEIGQLVQVQPRTWPGINQPGGVGRITGSNSSGTRVAVTYVIDGRREKEIDTVYVSSYEDSSRLRDRSVLLGRCRRCGSLRSDCGSCDLRKQEQEQAVLWQRYASQEVAHNLPPEDEGVSSSSGEESIAEVLNNVRKLESQSRKFKRLLRRSRRYLNDDPSHEEQSINSNPKIQTSKSHAPISVYDSSSVSRTPQRQPSNSPDFGLSDLSPPFNDGNAQDSGGDSESDDSLILQALTQRHRRNQKKTRNVHMNLSDGEDDFSSDDSEDELPLSGVPDDSSEIPYESLPEYCDGIVGRLEYEQLPAARRQLVRFERESVSPSPTLTNRLTKTYQEWVEQLVRKGTDQCQSALRKISRYYRHNKQSLPAIRRQEFRGTGMEVRETRVDNLSRAVEEMMSRLWQLTRKVQGLETDSDEEIDENDGWADPTHFESPQPQSSQSPTPESQNMLANDILDPHPYASRKRRPPASHKGRFLHYRRKRQSTKSHSRAIPRMTQRSSQWIGERRPSQRDGVDNAVALDQDSVCEEITDKQSIDGSDSGTGRIEENSRQSKANEGKIGVRNSRAKRRKVSSEKSVAASGVDKSSLRNFFSVPSSMSSRAAPDQECAVDRMESFLRANGIEDDTHVDLTSDSIFQDNRRASHDNRLKRHDFESDSRDVQSILIGIVEAKYDTNRHGGTYGQNASHLSWFDGVRSLVHETSPERMEPHHSLSDFANLHEYNVEEMCALLESEYDSKASHEALRKLSHLCASDGFGTFEDARKIVNSLWKCLRTNGKHTLQHFVASRNTQDLSRLLLLHVSVLNGIAGLMASYPSIVPAITDPISFSDYVDFVVFQFAESFLSILLPGAWNLQIDNPDQLVRQLDPLRRSLGRHCNLLENSAQCLIKRLPSQQWRLSLDKAIAYVTCIEPVWWSEFLRSGEKESPPDVASLRYGDLKVSLPRRESDAIWALLGFTGLERTQGDIQAPCARRLISFLFSAGPMLATSSQCCLPPSPAQIYACAEELHNTSLLLWNKSFDSMTMKDSILVNLIKRSIILCSEHVGGVEEERIKLFPVYRRESKDWRNIKALQKQLCLRSEPDNVQQIKLQNVFNILSTSHTFLGQDECLPSTNVVRQSLLLLVAWHNVLPCKKLRYINLEKMKNNLVGHFISTANTDSIAPQDAFQQAFSTTTPAQSGQGDKRKGIILLEAAAYLEMVHAIAIGSSNQLPPGVEKVDSVSLIKRVWGILTVSDKIPFDSGLETLLGAVKDCPFSQDPYFLCVFARTIACAGLLCEQFLPSAMEEKDYIMLSCPLLTVTDLGALRNFTFGCLITCFHLAVSLASSVEATCFVLQRLLVYINQVSKVMADEMFAWVDPLLLEKLDKTCTACISGIIASSYCGSEEDICLSLSLMVADFVSLSKHCKILKTKQQTTFAEDDMWGGLDDSLFTSIDVGNDLNKIMEDDSDLILAKALLESMPSKRFVSHPHDGNSCTSVQGRLLVGRRLKWIAHSIVLRWLVSRQVQVQTALSTFFKPACRIVRTEEDFDDLYFCNKASSVLLNTLCHLWQNHSISVQEDFVSSHNIILKTMEHVLDSFTIAYLPSKVLAASAIEGISASDTAPSQELVLYEQFRQGGLRTTKKNSRKAWSICRMLVSMKLAGDKDIAIVDCFNRATVELLSNDALLMASSMEQELGYRLKFLLGLLQHCQSAKTFEVLVSTSIGIVSTEILRLLYRIGSATKAAQHPTKLFHVLNGYILLHGWILAFTLSQDKCQGKVSKQIQDHVVEYCLIPLLLQQKKAIDIVAGNINFATFSVIHVPSHHPEPLGPMQLPSVWAESWHILHREMIAQCTCWFVEQASSGNQDLSFRLLNSLFMSATDRQSASNMIGGIFGVKLPEDVCTYTAPDLQNTFLVTMSKDFRTERFTQAQVSHWMCHILEHCFAQKLKRSYLKEAEKIRLLYLLEYLLHHCQKGKLHKLSFSLEAFTLACVGHSLVYSLKSAITSINVDCNLLEASLTCLSNLFGLPSKIVVGNGFGWIADWCSDSDASADKDVRTTKARQYLQRVMILSSAICNAVIDASDPASVAFHDFRRRLLEAKCDYWEPLGKMNASLIENIQSLENELGLTTTTQVSQSRINNVYAAKKEQGEIVPFSPDEKAQAAAKRFLNEVRRSA